jgi:hypothetical protein
MLKKDTYGILLPEKLIAELKKVKPPKIAGYNPDRMNYLISQILTHKQESYPGSYSMLNMVYLNKIVPRSNQYLNWLRDNGFIEWLNYSAGRNSRLYRITKLYEGRGVWRSLSDQKFIRRIKQKYTHLRTLNSKKYPVLNSYVHMVRINVPEAIKTAEETYRKGIKIDRKQAEGRQVFSLAEIQKISSGEIYIKCSKTNGRYDTNYTRLPSELVQHLTINDKPFSELDLSNSQPFFSACLFSATPEIQHIISNTLYILTKNMRLAEKQDVILYRSLVSSGTFYNYMEDQFNKAGLKFADRGELKKQLFIVFFGKNSAIHYSQTVKIFASLFPDVYSLFEEIKRKEHNRLAILLQRIESYVILQRVTPEIIKRYPGLPFLTKHDSLLPSGLMVTNQVDEICKLMIDTITEVTGLTPTIKVKGKNDLDTINHNIPNKSISSDNLSVHYLNQNTYN